MDSAVMAMLTKGKLDKPIILWDEQQPGLGIRINRDKSSMYILKLSIKNKATWLTLADTRLLTQEDARRIAIRAKILARHSLDPAATVQMLIDECLGTGTQNKVITFKDWAEHYITRYAKLFKKSWIKDRQRIDRYLLPIWGDRSLIEITRQDVMKLHWKIGKENGHYAANRLAEQLHVMFKQAAYMQFLPPNHPNPASGIKMYRERSRDRVMTPSEKQKALKAINDLDDPTFRAALLLLFHTGFRHQEIVKLKWTDINIEAKVIHLDDTKAGRSFAIPIPPQVIELLTSLPSYKYERKYVFPSKIDRDGHISRLDKVWSRVKESAGIDRSIRVHDVRRTFGSRLVEQTRSLPLVGRALNQSNQSTTEIYARYSDDPVRAALTVHSDELQSMMS